MKISHLGAKDCVTGSCHLIETKPGSADSINILVDCGTAYGDAPELPFGQFPVPSREYTVPIFSGSHAPHGNTSRTALQSVEIVFVGYQAKGTPGRKMIKGKIPVKATIHTLTAYSAHADQQMLVDWVRAMPEPPKEIRLVHGETDARRALGLALGITKRPALIDRTQAAKI